MNDWKSQRLADFDSVHEFTTEFQVCMEACEAARADLGEPPLSEVDKINTLANAIKDTPYNVHRVAWLNNPNPAEATVMKYIEVLRKDAATDLVYSREKGLVANYSKGSTRIESQRSKKRNGKRKASNYYERNQGMGSTPAKMNKNSSNKKFPDRARDTKAVNHEKAKLDNRNTSSKGKYCDHCHKNGHIINDCWTLYPEMRPPSFEKGKLLRGIIENDSDGDERIPYKYDDDERAICLTLRDTGIIEKREVKYATQKLADDNEAARMARNSVNHEKCFMARNIVPKST
jgi:hypothetical protein